MYVERARRHKLLKGGWPAAQGSDPHPAFCASTLADLRTPILDRLIPLLVAALLLTNLASGGVDKASLRNLKSIQLNVVVDGPCTDVTDAHAIEQAIGLKVRMAGIKVTDTVRDPEAMLTAGITCTPVSVGVDHRLLGYAADVQLELSQLTILERLTGESILASTWRARGGILTCSPAACTQRVQSSLEVQINEFLNDYLSVNPTNRSDIPPRQ